MNESRLHPDHLSDLRKSGLSDEMIDMMGVRSVRPADIPRLLGWNPQEVQSALGFPYPGLDFTRFKVFPPYTDRNGHQVKYLQRKGTGVHLYILPTVQKVLANPLVPLHFTEGEKKAAKAVQEGLMCIGLGGLWNWIEKETGEAIKEIDSIALVNREIGIVPDSDTWARPDLQKAIYALAKELEQRGARVSIIVTPQDGDEKVGLDDLLIKKGLEPFEQLDRIGLKHPTMKRHSKWWKIWKQEKEKKRLIIPSCNTGNGAKIIASELENRIIHPAIHIEPGFSSVGVINRNDGLETFSIITSSRSTFPAQEVEQLFTTKPIIHPGLSGRWRQSGKVRTLSESLALLIQKMRELVWFEDERWYPVISLWGTGTYLFPAFPAFPYLQLTGEKSSGKTKIQDILECSAFNALKVIDPTPAVLFRVVHALRPTLLVDEAEKMNTEEAKEIRGIINAGYKRGATVPRVEGEDRHLTFFEVYSPKCLAGIRGLGAVTEDRCITVVMSKPSQDDPRQNRIVNPLDSDWATIRDGFYQLPLSYAERILQGLDTARLPSWLRARDRELWSPLVQLASLADQESGLGVFEDVLGLAHESVKEKGLTFEAEAVLGLLESMMDGKDTLRVHPVDLVEGLESSLNRKGKISPEWIAGRLRSLGFRKADPPRDNRGVIYEVGGEKLSELRCRYTPLEQPTHLHAQELTQAQAMENKGEF